MISNKYKIFKKLIKKLIGNKHKTLIGNKQNCNYTPISEKQQIKTRSLKQNLNRNYTLNNTNSYQEIKDGNLLATNLMGEDEEVVAGGSLIAG